MKKYIKMKNLLVVAVALIFITSCSPKNETTETENAKNIHKVSVRVKTIKPEKFISYFEVNGFVEALQNAFISPELNGQIKQINVEEGQRVSKGDILAVLNTDITRKGVEELKTGLEFATVTFEKQKELWDQKIGSEIQFLQAKNTKESLEKKLETLEEQLEMANVRAPFDGIVDEIFSKVGEMGTPGRQIVQLVNLSKLIVEADVSEAYISKINKGDTVQINFPAYPDIVLYEPIYRTGNVINPDNRTFKIQVRINNVGEKFKPNIMANIKIEDYVNDSAFVVPSIIIKKDINKGSFIFEAQKTDSSVVANKIFIEPGVSYNDKTVIKKGVTKNQQIIVDGYNMVATGTDIEIK